PVIALDDHKYHPGYPTRRSSDLGDGKTDLLYDTTTPNTLRVMFSNGDGTFTFGPPIPIPAGAAAKNDWAFGDFNGDGKTDISYRVPKSTRQKTSYVADASAAYCL